MSAAVLSSIEYTVSVKFSLTSVSYNTLIAPSATVPVVKGDIDNSLMTGYPADTFFPAPWPIINFFINYCPLHNVISLLESES